MIPHLGAYYRPDRLSAALALLASAPQARVLAGGTDLLLGSERLDAVVDITHLGLGGMREEDDALLLGATLRVEELLHAPAAHAWADGVLVGACLNFGTLQVRNMATVGGNVAHALPAADLVAALIALDAEARLARAGPQGGIRWRTLPVAAIATAPFATCIEPAELIAEVRVPARARARRAQFRKIGRVVKDLAQVNCAVALDLEGERVREARIVVGAVHPTVTRVPTAEVELHGADTRGAEWRARVARAVSALRDFIQPITDTRATREWRRHVCGVLVRRSLEWVADPSTRGRVPRYEDGPLYRVGVREARR
ncbi:MAG: FAD binding domain-containing protein [Candidatus Latescibacterota bacterium]|nr:MAG: FAD binding domain-containing protein [Candidatus Latescibacterota bacterium]